MTLPDDKMRDCLQYRLLGPQDELGSWGHEYVRHVGLGCSIWVLVYAQIALSSQPALLFLLAHAYTGSALIVRLQLWCLSSLAFFF